MGTSLGDSKNPPGGAGSSSDDEEEDEPPELQVEYCDAVSDTIETRSCFLYFWKGVMRGAGLYALARPGLRLFGHGAAGACGRNWLMRFNGANAADHSGIGEGWQGGAGDRCFLRCDGDLRRRTKNGERWWVSWMESW